MPSKEQSHSRDTSTARQHPSQHQVQEFETVDRLNHPARIVQRAVQAPRSLTPEDVLRLHSAVGNRAVLRLPGADGPARVTGVEAVRAALLDRSGPGTGSRGSVQRQQEKEEPLQMQSLRRQAKVDMQRVGLEGGPVSPEVQAAVQTPMGGFGRPAREIGSIMDGPAAGSIVQLVPFKDGLVPSRGEGIYKKIKQMAAAMNLKPGQSSFRDVFAAVFRFAAAQEYSAGGATPTVMIENDVWNCESLTYLLLFLKGYVEDTWLDPLTHTGGWTEAAGRRFSRPDLEPNMRSIRPPNVKLDGERRLYTFQSHMWAEIDGGVFDPITGATGPSINEIWPHVMVNNQLVSLGLVNYELAAIGVPRANGMVEYEFVAHY
jgi:hypothetical protein